VNINTVTEGLGVNETGVGTNMEGKVGHKGTIGQEGNGKDRI
jgi:hypothetical protein